MLLMQPSRLQFISNQFHILYTCKKKRLPPGDNPITVYYYYCYCYYYYYIFSPRPRPRASKTRLSVLYYAVPVYIGKSCIYHKNYVTLCAFITPLFFIVPEGAREPPTINIVIYFHKNMDTYDTWSLLFFQSKFCISLHTYCSSVV
jgi:hypothetical protein